MKYCYAQAPMDGQSVDAQMRQLTKAGCKKVFRETTGEGRARAKARGRSDGRKFKLTYPEKREAITRRENGEPWTEIDRSYNVSAATITRLSREVAP